MSDDDTLLAEIIELAKTHTAAKPVEQSTRLYADLGMTGDDADEFMIAFAVKYGVDMSGLVWLRFFDDEITTNDLLAPALTLAASVLSPSFTVRWNAARDAEREITIAHLVEVARAKVWYDPEETFRRRPRSSPLTLIFSLLSLATLTFFFLLGVFVSYGLTTHAFGDGNLLSLFGTAAMSLLVPVYIFYSSWKSIQRKLASA